MYNCVSVNSDQHSKIPIPTSQKTKKLLTKSRKYEYTQTHNSIKVKKSIPKYPRLSRMILVY